MRIRKGCFCLLVTLFCGCAPSFAEPPSVTLSVLAQSPADPSPKPPTGYPARPSTEAEYPTATANELRTTPADVPEPVLPVTLAFTGDIMLGRSLAERIRSGGGDAIFASVEPVLQSSDLVVGNLECAIGEGGKRAPKAFTFLAPPQAAALLFSAGFDLVSLANNHSMDYGLDVFDQTRALLSENRIHFAGAGANAVEAHSPVVFSVGGWEIALLAYVEVPMEYSTQFDARIWEAGPEKPGVAWAEDGKIQEDLLATETADFTIVLFHFGTEGSEMPDKRQVQLARMAIDYGADLVVGTHPHVLQEMERYKDRWIFYSLGNFVFDGFEGKSNRSAILRTTLLPGRDPEYSLVELTIIGGIPVIGE
jgi:poly-gamma-glutamate capsule biosynthesis protein CapA/YwtB (metallophosphatase superfamily)